MARRVVLYLPGRQLRCLFPEDRHRRQPPVTSPAKQEFVISDTQLRHRLHLPKLARQPFVASRIVIALVVLALAGCDDLGFGPDIDDPDLQVFVGLMNDHRESVGCERLMWNDAVATVAQAHSMDMVERQYFDHTNPDGDSPFDRLQDADLNYSNAGENIAAGQQSPEAVLDAWLNSPGHRSNIENCSFTEHGMGLSQWYWTHLFYTP
jgi:uncharacterized protein YkwD